MALALPASASIKDMKLDAGAVVGVFSSYAETLGCLAEVVDLTILPNGLPGIVVRGTERMRVLPARRTEGELRYGAIEKLPPVGGELSASHGKVAAFVDAVSSAGVFRKYAPRFSSSHQFNAVDFYAIANKFCSGLERINILKADSLDHIFEELKRSIPGASLFTVDFAPRTSGQATL